jgi:hypothetical protein
MSSKGGSSNDWALLMWNQYHTENLKHTNSNLDKSLGGCDNPFLNCSSVYLAPIRRFPAHETKPETRCVELAYLLILALSGSPLGSEHPGQL